MEQGPARYKGKLLARGLRIRRDGIAHFGHQRPARLALVFWLDAGGAAERREPSVFLRNWGSHCDPCAMRLRCGRVAHLPGPRGYHDSATVACRMTLSAGGSAVGPAFAGSSP